MPNEVPEMILCQDCGHRMYRHDPYVSGDGCAGVAATETEPGYECACSLSIVEIARAAGAAAERERAKGLVEAARDFIMSAKHYTTAESPAYIGLSAALAEYQKGNAISPESKEQGK